MRVFITQFDLVMSKLGGPPGVLYLIVTYAQVRTYGWRHWAKWGFGTGVLKDGFEQLEQEAKKQIEKLEREISEGAEALERDI